MAEERGKSNGEVIEGLEGNVADYVRWVLGGAAEEFGVAAELTHEEVMRLALDYGRREGDMGPYRVLAQVTAIVGLTGERIVEDVLQQLEKEGANLDLSLAPLVEEVVGEIGWPRGVVA